MMSERHESGSMHPAQISLIQLRDIATKLGITAGRPMNYRYIGTYLFPDDEYVTIVHNMLCRTTNVNQYMGLAESSLSKKSEELRNFGFRVEFIEKTKAIEVPNGFYISAVTHLKKIK